MIDHAETRKQTNAIMGQQHKKLIKRRRRTDYLKRKKELIKLGESAPKLAVKSATPKTEAAKKAPAKKTAAKKAAKKVAKKTTEEETEG
ncbi:MAG: hypothetical protein EAZ42_07700 [Verrucomicrobia bacterium]|nr:MAG: hypothetical protein EAZ42_07700 [Verrucomicrobiota bacterium]